MPVPQVLNVYKQKTPRMWGLMLDLFVILFKDEYSAAIAQFSNVLKACSYPIKNPSSSNNARYVT